MDEIKVLLKRISGYMFSQLQLMNMIAAYNAPPPPTSTRGRQYKLSSFTISSGTNKQIASADPYRTGLIISNQTGNNIFVAPDSSLTGSTGILVANNSSLMLSYRDWGPYVQLDWYANTAGINVIIGVNEIWGPIFGS